MNDFSNIPSQFDSLVPDHPVVFISYSWDSDDHTKWVRKLADDLRVRYAVNVLLDQYNRAGIDLLDYMLKGITKADRVLLIGTPLYKEKTERYEGGAKYEDQIISAELYHKMGTAKFIPVLRCGEFTTSFGPLINTRNGYIMVDDSKYDDVLHQLAAELWGEPINRPPIIGSKPNFKPISTYPQKPTTVINQKSKIFLNYSNKDIDYKEGLVNALQVYNGIEIVHKWSCEDITEYTWNNEMQKEFVESDICIFMLSANYFRYKYILERVVPLFKTNNRIYICVIVKEFGDLENINKSILTLLGSTSENNKVYSEFEYFPYDLVRNNLTKTNERKLIPLANYENLTGNDISSAYNIISQKIIGVLSKKKK